MNLRDLEYFLSVAELGHFGQAAQQCGVSQPTLSGQIKKLEQTLGVVLFERSNRRVMITAAGLEIAVHARRVLSEIEAMTDFAMRSKDPRAGKFRIGAFPTVSAHVFSRLVKACRGTMPDLRLILVEEKTDSLIAKLKSGVLDAAFLALPIVDNALCAARLFDDEFFLAVHPEHPLSGEIEIVETIPKAYRLLLLEEGHCLRDQSLEVCHRHGIGEQDFKATSLETLREMVKAGTGMTLIPRSAIRQEEAGIIYLPFRQPAPKRTIALVWRKTITRPAVIKEILLGFGIDDCPQMN
ncbi:MAG: LysR substrate-binding domain-containing protein [Myxococcota bacterium]|nr:LysR substrate-binding domain-containing protein [Myxococcota bacterium]